MSGLMTMEDDTPPLECEAPLHEAARQATGFSGHRRYGASGIRVG